MLKAKISVLVADGKIGWRTDPREIRDIISLKWFVVYPIEEVEDAFYKLKADNEIENEEKILEYMEGKYYGY